MIVGLTTGVYDLLHEGHRNLFLRAAELCDHLVVAVASDWLTRVQKGPTRPVQDEETRLREVLRCTGVERAFVTDRLDFTDFAGLVDLIVLGEDQRNVRAGPIPTARLTRTPGISTTELIAHRSR